MTAGVSASKIGYSDGRALEVDTQLLEEKLNSQELVIDEDAVSGRLEPLSHLPINLIPCKEE